MLPYYTTYPQGSLDSTCSKYGVRCSGISQPSGRRHCPPPAVPTPAILSPVPNYVVFWRSAASSLQTTRPLSDPFSILEVPTPTEPPYLARSPNASPLSHSLDIRPPPQPLFCGKETRLFLLPLAPCTHFFLQLDDSFTAGSVLLLEPSRTLPLLLGTSGVPPPRSLRSVFSCSLGLPPTHATQPRSLLSSARTRDPPPCLVACWPPEPVPQPAETTMC